MSTICADARITAGDHKNSRRLLCITAGILHRFGQDCAEVFQFLIEGVPDGHFQKLQLTLKAAVVGELLFDDFARMHNRGMHAVEMTGNVGQAQRRHLAA